MKLYAFSPSSRVVGISALIEYLKLPCERVSVDLSRGEHLSSEYRALNPNHKSPTLVDGEFVLWEGNAILSYLAAHSPESRLWPSEPRSKREPEPSFIPRSSFSMWISRQESERAAASARHD